MKAGIQNARLHQPQKLLPVIFIATQPLFSSISFPSTAAGLVLLYPLLSNTSRYLHVRVAFSASLSTDR